MTDVDVVIPVRDGARFLGACLDSVMAQTFAPRMVIVVDDGSTDATPRILADYAARWRKLEVIRSDPRGVSHARNLGIRASRAAFVAFLDSDDIWTPDKLERQVALLSTAGPQVGFVHCSCYCIDESGDRIEGCAIVEPRRRGNVFRELVVEGNIISGSGSAVVARRDLVDRVGGFDERLFFGEDWQLWIKLSEISEVDFVRQPLVGVRLHGGSAQNRVSSRKQEQLLHQTLLVLDRWYGTEGFPSELGRHYGQRAVDAATMQGGTKPSSRAWGYWKFFSRLKNCDSRFGRELFSSRIEFLSRIYFNEIDFSPRMYFMRTSDALGRAKARSLFQVRGFIVLILKCVLPQAVLDRLKRSLRARTGGGGSRAPNRVEPHVAERDAEATKDPTN